MDLEKTRLSGIKAAIIDLDGTMIDTALDFRAALNTVRADLSLSPQSLELVRTFVGRGFERLVRGSLSADYDENELEKVLPRARELFLKHYADVNGKESVLYPEVSEGLQAFRDKGLRLACVTNKQSRFAIPLMKKLKIHDFFDVIYPGDALEKMKPDPLPMLTACKHFGIETKEAVVIGDSVNDFGAARAAGCRMFALPYGYNHGRPVQEIDSDGIVQTILDASRRIN